MSDEFDRIVRCSDLGLLLVPDLIDIVRQFYGHPYRLLTGEHSSSIIQESRSLSYCVTSLPWSCQRMLAQTKTQTETDQRFASLNSRLEQIEGVVLRKTFVHEGIVISSNHDQTVRLWEVKVPLSECVCV